MLDYYNLLRVPLEAPAETIRAAFRREAKRFHPDAGPQAPPAEREARQRRFILIAQAYDTLRDPARRRAYDRQWRLRFGERDAAPGRRGAGREAAGAGPRPQARATPSKEAPVGDHAASSHAASSHAAGGRTTRGKETDGTTGGNQATSGTATAEDREHLLRDVEDLLGRFGLDLKQPFERVLETLLDWARALFREVAGPRAPRAESRGPRAQSAARRAASGGEPDARPGGQSKGSGGGRSETARPRSRRADPERIERELAELKRRAGRKD